jgi:hypothetical protein
MTGTKPPRPAGPVIDAQRRSLAGLPGDPVTRAVAAVAVHQPGPCETGGTSTRAKMLKRQMYGRARFGLLARVLLA